MKNKNVLLWLVGLAAVYFLFFRRSASAAGVGGSGAAPGGGGTGGGNSGGSGGLIGALLGNKTAQSPQSSSSPWWSSLIPKMSLTGSDLGAVASGVGSGIGNAASGVGSWFSGLFGSPSANYVNSGTPDTMLNADYMPFDSTFGFGNANVGSSFFTDLTPSWDTFNGSSSFDTGSFSPSWSADTSGLSYGGSSASDFSTFDNWSADSSFSYGDSGGGSDSGW